MGKYMKKSKISGDVAVMEVSISPQSFLGVQTSAKILALKKLQQQQKQTYQEQWRNQPLRLRFKLCTIKTTEFMDKQIMELSRSHSEDFSQLSYPQQFTHFCCSGLKDCDILSSKPLSEFTRRVSLSLKRKKPIKTQYCDFNIFQRIWSFMQVSIQNPEETLLIPCQNAQLTTRSSSAAQSHVSFRS
ncbi:hypothetical protein ACFX2I_047302 [Malus domestica]